MTIRNTGSDFASDVKKKQEDPILKGEKDSKTGYQVTLPDRNVGPSSTQVNCKGRRLQGRDSFYTLLRFNCISGFHTALLKQCNE